MIVQRTERHLIAKNNSIWSICDSLCFKSKNLYNYANYIKASGSQISIEKRSEYLKILFDIL